MNNIQLRFSNNFRYLLFEIDGQYYLLDRHPTHLICYIVLPTSFLFYQKVYPIKKDVLLKLEKKETGAGKYTIPTSLVGGAAVLANTYSRINNINPFQYFETQFSLTINFILLFLSWFVIYGLIQWLYASKKKDIQKIIGTELNSPFHCKIRVESIIKFVRNILGIRIFAWLMLLIPAILFFLTGNLLLIFMSMIGTATFKFSALLTLTPSNTISYTVSDILPERNEI